MSSSHQPVFRFRFLLPRYWATWSGIMFVSVLAMLPDAVRTGLGECLAPLLLRFAGKRKHIAMTNLSLCYPHLPESEKHRLLARHARILAHTFLGYGQLLFGSAGRLSSQFDVDGMNIVQDEVAKGKNIILLTPHSLALEYAAQYLTIHQPMVAAVRLHVSSELLDWIVTRFRTRYRGVIYDNTASLLGVVKQVRSGKWLYYLPDEDGGRENALFSPFYGIPKASPPMLGKLAKSCRATVIPVTTLYCPDRRRFSIRFHEPLEGLTGIDKAADSLRQNQSIERILDADPAQYMWSVKIFRTRPEGESGLY